MSRPEPLEQFATSRLVVRLPMLQREGYGRARVGLDEVYLGVPSSTDLPIACRPIFGMR